MGVYFTTPQRFTPTYSQEIVAPKDEQVAEKLSIALIGKGAFRRFKDVLHGLVMNGCRHGITGETILYKAMQEWFASLPMIIADA